MPDEIRPTGASPAASRNDSVTTDFSIDDAAPSTPSTAEIQMGKVIANRYRILSRIGGGGMGEVFLAEQWRPVRRQVALKLIKAGADSRSVLLRFEAERQALAMMDHPNIARIFDGGTTDYGQPFFVMELVHGGPITHYCDVHHLGIRSRLELFIQVCHALQHAHQKGIVHRDIKPSNVMVTTVDDQPLVKVIDFGLAKAVGPDGNAPSQATEYGSVVGTLEYMSPEQAELTNQDIDTRSDVYSLGVLLYELLTGSTPLQCLNHRLLPILETLRLVREGEARRPSVQLTSLTETLPDLCSLRGTSPVRLIKEIRGELDWIVLKCLEKDRSRRYEGAHDLLREVQRYLDGEAVEACPPTTIYLAKKFLRRYRGLVLTTGLMIFLLLGGMIATTVALLESQVQRQLALEANTRAAESRLLRLIDERTHVLEGGINDAVESLIALQAAFGTWPELSRDQFSRFVQRILQRHPEIQALEWVPRVRHDQRAAFEMLARKEGVADFEFRELNPDGGLRTAPIRTEYFPVLYAEPAERNRPAIGLDLGASPPRRKALQTACDQGKPISTAPIRLAQEKAQEMGFLVVLPVFTQPCVTPEERQQHLSGYVLAVLRTRDLVERVLGDLVKREVTFCIHDLGEDSTETLIYGPATFSTATGLQQERSIEVCGRSWRVTFAALPEQ